MESRELPRFGVVTTSVAAREKRPQSGGYQPGGVWRVMEQRAYELGMSACLFRPEDADWSRGRVHAWVCERDGEERVWERRYGPLPDIVFENVYVHLSATRAVRDLRRRLTRLGIPVFNPPLGSKDILADWLQGYPKLWQHHPETVRWRREEEVLKFLVRHPSAYLKPVQGSAGQGILEIRPQEGGYFVRAAKYGRTKKTLARHLTHRELLRFLQRERRQGRFILQAGVELLHIEAGKVDLRTHLQRNLKGEWELVDLIVKRGRPGSIVSNYHAGGDVHPYEWLTAWAKDSRVKLPSESEITDLSKRIAAAYADKAQLLGSLGLDLGIDTDGEIWLLDVNSRPGRNILDEAGKERCQVLNAEFAAYLYDRLREEERE
jgi:glutathione synthase/RimK-type ligase-like ATP-grasp enzyme